MTQKTHSIIKDLAVAMIYFSLAALVGIWRVAWQITLHVAHVVRWPFAVAYSIYMWVVSAIMIPLLYLGGVATMFGVFCGIALGTIAVKLGLGPAPRHQRRSRRHSSEFYGSAYSSGLCTPTETPALFYYVTPQADSDDMEFEEPTDPDVTQTPLGSLDGFPPQRKAPPPCVAAPAGSCALTSASMLIPLSKPLDSHESDYLIFYEDSDDGYQTPRRTSFHPSEQTIVEEDE